MRTSLTLPILAILAGFTLFMGCKKDKAEKNAPTVVTITPGKITDNSATSGGRLVNAGSSALTEYGICYSSSNPTPSVNDGKVISDTNTDIYESLMTGLTAQSKYYVRAYAINRVGISYGQVEVFTTDKTQVQPLTVTFTYNGKTVVYGIITSSITGRKWLDRNLGAPNPAVSYDDFVNYGDLFQYGRPDDGHQVVQRLGNTNQLTSGTSLTDNRSFEDKPGHSFFIASPGYVDWRYTDYNHQPSEKDLWGGADRENNPCPKGWRIPTQGEFAAERITNAQTGFERLKLTFAGKRSGQYGNFSEVSVWGSYWVSEESAFIFRPDGSYLNSGEQKNNGLSCRCILDN